MSIGAGAGTRHTVGDGHSVAAFPADARPIEAPPPERAKHKRRCLSSSSRVVVAGLGLRLLSKTSKSAESADVARLFAAEPPPGRPRPFGVTASAAAEETGNPKPLPQVEVGLWP